MTMTPLSAPQFCSPSPPTSSWRQAVPSETPAQTHSCQTASRKPHTQLARLASSPQAEAPNPGAGDQFRDWPDLEAVFKSP